MPATDKLIAGYQRFLEGYYLQNKDYLKGLAKNGQSPKIAIVSCCDSRVDPTIILDCDPGDLFGIRNVANLVPPCEIDEGLHGTSAALEFAVLGLNVESIIVLGHSQCGGIKSLMDTPPNSSSQSFIDKWMRQLQGVRENIVNVKYDTVQQGYRACEEHAISQSLTNLMTYDWLRARVQAGKLRLHGWYYDLDCADLFAIQDSTNTFQKIN